MRGAIVIVLAAFAMLAAPRAYAEDAYFYNKPGVSAGEYEADAAHCQEFGGVMSVIQNANNRASLAR